MPVVSQDLVMAGLTSPRLRGTEHDAVVADIGNVDTGEGVRVTLVPNYLLIELATSEDEGELWIPLVTLLEAIGKMNRKTGN